MMLKVQSSNFTAGTVHTGKALLCSITVSTNGTADGSVIVYDNTAASGTILDAIGCPGTEDSKTVTFPHPISASTGLHVAVTGTGASANITYSTDGQSFQ